MRRSYRRKVKLKLKKETIYTIAQIGLFAVSGLIILSFLNKGTALTGINQKISHYLGWGIYGLPIVLVLLAFNFSKIKSKLTKPDILVGFTLSWLTLLSLTKAGLIGSEIWINIENLLSPVGAYLILFGCLVIGLVVFFNTSIDELLGLIIKLFIGIFTFFKKYFFASLFKKKPASFIFQDKLPIKVKGQTPPSAVSPEKQLAIRKEEVKKAQTALVATDLGTSLVANIPAQKAIWEYPPLSLLSEVSGQKADRGNLRQNADVIEKTLESFGITARVTEVNGGPAVTQYALEIAMGTKLSKITSLSNDLALALAAPTGQIRIEAPIPGRSLVGIEIPNRSLEFVTLKTMLASEKMQNAKEKLIVALGLDVSGSPLVVNVAKMPHVLIAGTTGSGKSVMINSFIGSLLFRTTPNEVRIILVDPKRVELIGYNGIPHLLTPVIVEVEKILSALKWALSEMERRYKLFASNNIRNIDGFNELSGFQALPYIVIIIDELADLMAYAPVEVEDAICRLAQMARATGIHLILSTQSPRVDVITGLIKANIPCRIAFNVTSMIDSRVIIDMPGAEKLLGRGDMLFIPPDQAKPTRIQGSFVSEKEIQKLVEFLKSKNLPVEYTEEVTTMPTTAWRKNGTLTNDDGKDEFFEEAVKVVCQYDRASASLLQRRLSIGYARAARIIDQLESTGIVGPGEGSKPRDVLVKNAQDYFSQKQQSTNQ